jgi:polyisoprenoid-binding protein YceI
MLSRPVTLFSKLALFLLPVALLLTACAAPNDPTEAVTVAPTSAGPDEAAALSEGQLRLVVAPEGNEARYLVTEQLARLKLPSDAIGRTKAVTGQIVLDADGAVIADQSHFTVDLSTLASDSRMRDNYLRRNVLETADYPNAEFVPSEVSGLPSPLPTAGPVAFQITGGLTVRDVTHAVTWDFAGEVQGDTLTGTASTAFTFEDFDLTQPRVPVVLSLEDNIRLELDLTLVKDS